MSAIDAIPHRPPMRAVRGVLAHAADASVVGVRVDADHPLVIDGRCPGVAAVELLAQAAAVHAALRGGAHGGVLLRVRGLRLLADAVPIGVDLEARVRRTDGTEGPTAAFAVALWDGERALAEGSLLVRATGGEGA